MCETRKQNIVKGYMLSRLSPLAEDDKEGFDTLDKMLKNIDPILQLKNTGDTNGIGSSLEQFKQFYYDTFGKPGTPEFDQKLKEIKERINKK